MQTRVGSVPHVAGDKAARKITHTAENRAENKGEKTGKVNRRGRGCLVWFCFLVLLNLALLLALLNLVLDLRDWGLGKCTRVYSKILLGIILLLQEQYSNTQESLLQNG